MNAFKKFFISIKKRPMTLIFMAIITFATTCLEHLNPLTKKYGSFSAIKKIGIMDILCNISDEISTLFRTPKLLFTVLGLVLLGIACISLAAGIVYSGFFFQMNQASEMKPKGKMEYLTGFLRYSFKLMGYFFCTIFCTVFVLICLFYCVVPLILYVKLFFAGHTNVIVPALIVLILTVIAVVVTVIFYTMYFTFAIPSIISFKRGGVGVAVRMVNGYCWYLMPRAITFLLVNAALRTVLMFVHYGLGGKNTTLFFLIAAWLLRTLVYYIYMHFAFNTFDAMKSDMFDA